MKEINFNDIKYLEVSAGVRHYQDTTVNGEDDIDMFEHKGEEVFPKVPCVKFNPEVKDTGRLNTEHLRWEPLIDVENGIIVNWVKGNTADIFYKICDDGKYKLIDRDGNTIETYDSYVPKCLCIDDEVYGDYIEFKVDENGVIHNWKWNEKLLKDLIDNAF